MASFLHPILPTVEGETDYQTIHATRKFLQANSREDTHLGLGTLEHSGLVISDASYAMIAPPTAEEPTFWVTPQAPGRAPATDGTAAQISAARHIWGEDVQTYRTYTSVINYSHSRNPPCAPARTHGQIQAPREPPN
jgi:hypothetical protein